MICNDIQKLIEYALTKALITEDDVMVVRNALMDTLGVDNWEEPTAHYEGETVDVLLEALLVYAAENGIIVRR